MECGQVINVYMRGIIRANMEQPVKFIKLEVTDKNNNVHTKFVNVNHIQIIYQSDNDIIIELADYTTLKICNQHILIFMDRFVK